MKYPADISSAATSKSSGKKRKRDSGDMEHAVAEIIRDSTSGGSRNWETGGGGADFCKNFYTPQLLALVCSSGVRGHVPPENLEI